MLGISKLASHILPSATLAIEAKAKQMKKDGVDVISFSAGEPDFDTPVYIKKAAIDSIDQGFTKYTPASGIPELKQAVCGSLKKLYGLDYQPAQVLISCGAKHSIYNALLAICQEGDEAVIPAPYWVSYPEMVKMTGAKPVILQTSEKNQFKFTAQDLQKVVTPKTKVLILNSPSNPTGQAYKKEALLEIAQVAVKNKFYILSDEIYDQLVYGGFKHYSIASLSAEVFQQTILVNGVSKTFAMTGWRIGYACGPQDVISAMSNIQSQSTSNPTSISQKAALSALAGEASVEQAVKTMVAEFAKRREFMVQFLNKIPGVTCSLPEGAFYAFPNFSAYVGKSIKGKEIKNAKDLAAYLLESAHVALVPGDEFGAAGYLRLSYATSMANIENGLERIKVALS